MATELRASLIHYIVLSPTQPGHPSFRSTAGEEMRASNNCRPCYQVRWHTDLVGLRRSEHITDALASVFTGSEHPSASSLNWRSITELFMALHLMSDRLQYVADLPTRRRGRLRSSTSSLPDVRPSRRVTVGDRSFAAADPRLWNSLPDDVQSAPSLTTFRQKLKTHLFRQ